MNFIRGLARLIIGLTFIFSGFVKIIDPVGTGLIVGEYVRIAGIVNLPVLCQLGGALLSAAELLIGIAVLLGLKMGAASKASLVFISFFTLLTLFLALFNPVKDCGCFGEAVKLSNWQTFSKNIILLGLALVIYFQREAFIPIAPDVWERGFLSAFILLVVSLSVYSFLHLPLIDFTDYGVGRDLREMSGVNEATSKPEFETVLVYKKNKTIKEFYIDSLPDSTWTFVDSKTKQVAGRDPYSDSMLEITDREGNYITDSLLFSGDKLFVTSIPYIRKISASGVAKSIKMHEELIKHGIRHIYLTGSSVAQADSLLAPMLPPGALVYYADYKTIITLNRSNAGTIYINDGIISAKWSRFDTPARKLDKIISEDPEYLIAKIRMRERVVAELTAFSILVLIMVLRYVCRAIYKHEPKRNDDN
jgi:triosephosphate isomerase